jgi:hypothetical protein
MAKADTSDKIRRKSNAHLKKSGVTQAGSMPFQLVARLGPGMYIFETRPPAHSGSGHYSLNRIQAAHIHETVLFQTKCVGTYVCPHRRNLTYIYFLRRNFLLSPVRKARMMVIRRPSSTAHMSTLRN